MQLFAIPILKNRLVYYCHSTLPTTSQLVKLVDWSNKKWDEFGEAKESSWKKKIHDKGNEVMNKLDYQEWFFKGIPTKEHLEHPLEKVVLYHPTQIPSADIELKLKQLLDQRIPYHKKYMIYSMYWVPVASTFAIVPLIPNIPLAYTLFRLYSHYKAYKGAQHLEELINDQTIQYETINAVDDLLPNHFLTSSDQVVFPVELIESYKKTSKLNTHILDQPISGVLDQHTINELSHKLNLPHLNIELQRARNQILASIFLEQNKH